MAHFGTLGVTLGLVFAVGAARAQPAETKSNSETTAETPEVPAVQAVQAPDLVLLKDGGMLRGTIVELIPKRRVLIVLVTGERRRIPMHQVEYAGPVSRAPSPPAQAAPPPAQTETRGPSAAPTANGSSPTGERVQLRAAQPDTTFHLRTGSGSSTGFVAGTLAVITVDTYARLCTAPCETTIGKGTYSVALSSEGGRPAPADEAVRINGPTVLEGDYQSYSGMRAAGWAILAGGILGGGAVLFTSQRDCDGTDLSCEPIDRTQFGIGMAIFGIGSLAGILMILKGDEAQIRVRPLALASAGSGAVSPRGADTGLGNPPQLVEFAGVF